MVHNKEKWPDHTKMSNHEIRITWQTENFNNSEQYVKLQQHNKNLCHVAQHLERLQNTKHHEILTDEFTMCNINPKISYLGEKSI